jgi:hypothetical protein
MPPLIIEFCKKRRQAPLPDLFYLLLTCSTVVDWFYLFMPGVLFVAKIF